MKSKQDENGNWGFWGVPPERHEMASCEKCGAPMLVVSGDNIWNVNPKTGRWEHDCEEVKRRSGAFNSI